MWQEHPVPQTEEEAWRLRESTSGLHQLHAHANVRDNGLEYLIELDVSNVEPRLNRRGSATTAEWLTASRTRSVTRVSADAARGVNVSHTKSQCRATASPGRGS